MTYQPPPPGAGGPPAKADPKDVNPLDWGIVGAGALAFIFSFFAYYTASSDGVSVGGQTYGGGSISDNAWAGGFFGWASVILAVVGAAVVAMAIFAPQVNLPVPHRLAGLGAFALATLFVILALFVGGYDVPDGVSGVDEGRGFGYWVSLIVIIAGLVLSLMRFQATGGQLPGNLQGKVPNVGGYGPQGGIAGGQAGPGAPGGPGAPPPPPAGNEPPPPPPGYGPPR